MPMTEKQVNEYMSNLLDGKIPAPAGLEGDALNQFRKITGELTQTDQRLRLAQREVEQLTDKLKQLVGQRTAYVNILIMAENARRGSVKPTPPTEDPPADDKPVDLAGLKEKMGADKVEVTDGEGNVLDSTEEDSPAADTPAD